VAVANETIIKKMIQELVRAQEAQHNREKMKKHIENVRLLSDLLLEDEREEQQVSTQTVNSADISEAELKTMMGSQAKPKIHKEKQTIIDHDDANGDSIFDF
jgi:altronate dehydratase